MAIRRFCSLEITRKESDFDIGRYHGAEEIQNLFLGIELVRAQFKPVWADWFEVYEGRNVS